ncbi:MAG TPA: ABC transporter permease, partial [Thermoanaerobacterales bacterium]|nr:ABC transporter permease [Thermoanaerobacterales bacterium]
MLKKFLGWFYALLVFCFLYVPILVLMAMSFNESQYNALPFKFSSKWYTALAQNTKLIDATVNSLYLATITGVICVILGTTLVLGLIECSPKIQRTTKEFIN